MNTETTTLRETKTLCRTGSFCEVGQRFHGLSAIAREYDRLEIPRSPDLVASLAILELTLETLEKKLIAGR